MSENPESIEERSGSRISIVNVKFDSDSEPGDPPDNNILIFDSDSSKSDSINERLDLDEIFDEDSSDFTSKPLENIIFSEDEDSNLNVDTSEPELSICNCKEKCVKFISQTLSEDERKFIYDDFSGGKQVFKNKLLLYIKVPPHCIM